MLKSKLKSSAKKKWRMPPDFRLVDFHKPLLSQPPVMLFLLGTGVGLLMTIGIIFHGGSH